MEKITINDLPRLKKKYKMYEMKYLDFNVVEFSKDSEKILFMLDDVINSKPLLYMPNYNNSILNIISSIKKYFNQTPDYNTFKPLDDILECGKYNHIAIMLLDGMGSKIIDGNLDETHFLPKMKVCDFNAVFPPTTACAIPAANSGLEPLRTGWVGWSNYFSEVDKFVVMFRNQEYFSGENLPINVRDIIPYEEFYNKLGVYSFDLGPYFTPSNCGSLKEVCDKYLLEINKHSKSYAYMYWNEPDAVMHINGAYSLEAKEEINKLNNVLEEFYQKLPEDSLVIVTADHGHIDVNPIYLANYLDLLSMLERVPSNEGRCAFFKVKRNRRGCFRKLFNQYFSPFFTLLTKDEFIEEGYLGEENIVNPKLHDFIGDYVAIAKSTYYFNFSPNIFSQNDDELIFKSHHAGITLDEMVIPFIALKK